MGVGALLAVAIGASVTQGVLANQAARAQSKALEDEGDLLRQESEVEARRLREQTRKNEARQRLSFLKNGVSVAGSPSLVLQETLTEGEDVARSVEGRGRNLRERSRAQAGVSRGQGRSALVSGLGNAAALSAFGSAGASSGGGGGGS